MDTLPYLCQDLITLELTRKNIPIKEAIQLTQQYQEKNILYSLLSSHRIDYLIHRYAPVLTCSVNPETGMDKSYAELYEESPEALIIFIKNSNYLEGILKSDILDLYRRYDALEIQVKQLDDYQNGRLNY
jgi:hypothetical protein